MQHAREDYNRIQDPEEKIPEEEPVFLIRAQDQVGFRAVQAWAHLNQLYGGSQEMTDAAYEQARKMEEWPKKKVADL